jgi:hypothetical protein
LTILGSLLLNGYGLIFSLMFDVLTVVQFTSLQLAIVLLVDERLLMLSLYAGHRLTLCVAFRLAFKIYVRQFLGLRLRLEGRTTLDGVVVHEPELL